MKRIPKKIIDRFTKTVPKFQKVVHLAKDRDLNESDTVAVLGDVLGEVFGYDKYLEVTSEFAIRGTYCDLALKVDNKVQFLIEAKPVGAELKEKHVKQAVDYGANHGIQWVILTNTCEWRLLRLRFEKPISYDLVCKFDFLELDPKDEKCQRLLYLMTKEGLVQKARDDFYEKIQSVNRYVVGNLILSEPVLKVLKRELKKIADGIKVEDEEVEVIVRHDVLKRDIVSGEDADSARSKINRSQRRAASKREAAPDPEPAKPKVEESISQRMLREAQASPPKPGSTP